MKSGPLTQEYLKTILEYNSTTGDFIWLVRKATKIHIGDIAGTLDERGYIHIVINKKIYKAHRLAFLYMTGEFPKNYTDHINQIKEDNCWHNLRECNSSQNQGNSKIPKTNTSGYKGVCWHKSDKKWFSQIRNKGRREHLGSFDCKHEAALTYNKRAVEVFGEFAHLNKIEDIK